MTNPTSEAPDRRAALRRMVGIAATPVALPMLTGVLGIDGSPLVSRAHAHTAIHPAAPNQGDLVHIPGAATPAKMTAEWNTGLLRGNDIRIAESQAAFEKAPATAARYEAKLYNFPSGNLRTLTYRKGGPVLHMVALETEIYVISGTATFSPLPGIPGAPVTVTAGDALFLPSGILSNPAASEDFVILQGFVSRTVREAKSAIVTARQAEAGEFAEWRLNGRQVQVTTPDAIAKAPRNAHRRSVKSYLFEGNAMHAITLGGGRSNTDTTTGSDVLVYVAKGRVRRREGDQTFDLVAGDCIRQRTGVAGYWEPLEKTLLIATEAPMRPDMTPPAVRGPL